MDGLRLRASVRAARLGRLRYLRTVAAGSVLTALVVLGSASPAAAQTSGGESAVERNARVAGSVVYLQITTTGYVRAPGFDWTGPFEVAGRCTGFFVTSTGHLVSAGHCVERTYGRESFIRGVIGQSVATGQYSEAEAQEVTPAAVQNWEVEGENNGSPLLTEVLAIQPRGVEGAVLDTAVRAQVLDYREIPDGDIALLKVDEQSTPALPIASADPPSGSPITAIGFPATVSAVTDPTRLEKATFNSGTVASNQVTGFGGSPAIGINAAISGGMSGGPTIDDLGNVVGVNSFSPVGEPQPFNFITDTTDLRDWIGAKNLALVPPRTADQSQTSGTPITGPGVPSWVWIALVATTALLAAGVVVVLVYRTRSGAGRELTSSVPPGPPPPFSYGGPGTHPEPWSSYSYGPANDRTTGADGNAGGAVVTEQIYRGACSRCQASNGPGARFCNGCGTAL